MDKTMLKIIATELPKGHTQAILESIKNFIKQQSLLTEPSSKISLIEDFFQRLLAIRNGATLMTNSRSKGSL